MANHWKPRPKTEDREHEGTTWLDHLTPAEREELKSLRVYTSAEFDELAAISKRHPDYQLNRTTDSEYGKEMTALLKRVNDRVAKRTAELAAAGRQREEAAQAARS